MFAAGMTSETQNGRAPDCNEQLRQILRALEVPLIAHDVRERLQIVLRRHGAEHVTLLLRTILESEGNENAMNVMAVDAISWIMVREKSWPERGLEWIEAFDKVSLEGTLEAMRALKCFYVNEAPEFYERSLRNQLRDILEPKPAASAPKVERKSSAERVIEEGLFLLQHKGPHSTSPISDLGRSMFGLDANDCSKVMNAARLYGYRVWLVKGLSRDALYELSAPSTSPDVREAVERKLRLGEKITAPEIRGARQEGS